MSHARTHRRIEKSIPDDEPSHLCGTSLKNSLGLSCFVAHPLPPRWLGMTYARRKQEGTHSSAAFITTSLPHTNTCAQWVADGIAVRIVIISGEVFVIDWLKRKKIGDHSATHNTHRQSSEIITSHGLSPNSSPHLHGRLSGYLRPM